MILKLILTIAFQSDGVDYATNIAKVRDDMHGSFNSEIDVTTSKPFF